MAGFTTRHFLYNKIKKIFLYILKTYVNTK